MCVRNLHTEQSLIPGLLMTPGLVRGMNLKCPWITFGVKNPCGMTFPEHFLIVAGFCQMTQLNSRVGNDTYTSLVDEFEVPMDHFWGQKPQRNDFSRAFPESGWVWSNDTP